MLILISDPFDRSLPDVLSKHGQVTDDQERLPEAEVVLIRSKTKVTREFIDGAPNLKLVIRGGVGLDNVDIEYAREKGIQVRNTPEASTIAVAELTFALMIALPNHLVAADRSMREGKWLKKELKRTELWEKTLGVIGMGRIGTAMAVRGRAFGMRVLAVDPRMMYSEFAEMRASIKDDLAEADYVTLHLPLTDGTRDIISADTLKWFKDGAYLINTSRGKCVIEQDVADALRSGKLAGYATDVWMSDPPDMSSPLFDAPNTLFTPHLGASSKENLIRIGNIIDRIVGNYMAGADA